MSNLLYIGVAVVLSVVGWLVLWLRQRRPGSTEASIREFSRELGALAPPSREEPDRPDGGRRSG